MKNITDSNCYPLAPFVLLHQHLSLHLFLGNSGEIAVTKQEMSKKLQLQTISLSTVGNRPIAAK